uniref:FRG domain-containing protein n=1 Tax=mine drainage metagenome TaxID=410659 RepID=E6PX38_9ZZZZ
MLAEQSEITCLASLEKALEELRLVFGGEAMWWRGHADAVNWVLRPSVFRKGRNGLPYDENALINNFLMRAYGRLGHRPRPGSDLEWLFLAQHYGLPTRLLDWTESPLVALYFAVSEENCRGELADCNACLWAVAPSELNKANSNRSDPANAQNGLISPENSVVQAIAMKALGSKDEVVWSRTGQNPYTLPQFVALQTFEIDERVVAQSGRFTLHSCEQAIESLADKDRYLRKFLIPASSKPTIRQRLKDLGIQKWDLFPDLQALALGLRDHEFTN